MKIDLTIIGLNEEQAADAFHFFLLQRLRTDQMQFRANETGSSTANVVSLPTPAQPEPNTSCLAVVPGRRPGAARVGRPVGRALYDWLAQSPARERAETVQFLCDRYGDTPQAAQVRISKLIARGHLRKA